MTHSDAAEDLLSEARPPFSSFLCESCWKSRMSLGRETSSIRTKETAGDNQRNSLSGSKSLVMMTDTWTVTILTGPVRMCDLWFFRKIIKTCMQSTGESCFDVCIWYLKTVNNLVSLTNLQVWTNRPSSTSWRDGAASSAERSPLNTNDLPRRSEMLRC